MHQQGTLALTGMPPRVLVLSHRPLVLSFFEGLARQAGFEFAGSVASPMDARRLIPTARPDLVVADISGGEAFFVAATEASKVCSVLALTHAHGDYTAHRAASAGIAGLISEEDSTATILEGLRIVAQGGHFLSPGVVTRRAGMRVMPMLSPAEQRLLPHVCRGGSDEAIGRALAISPRTVETQRCSIMKKLGVPDVASLFAVGIRLGVVTAAEIEVGARERRSAAR